MPTHIYMCIQNIRFSCSWIEHIYILPYLSCVMTVFTVGKYSVRNQNQQYLFQCVDYWQLFRVLFAFENLCIFILISAYKVEVLYNIKLGKGIIWHKIRIRYLNYSCISLYEKDTGQANQYMKSQSSFWANFNWSSMQLLSACFRQRTPFHIDYITLCERSKNIRIDFTYIGKS